MLKDVLEEMMKNAAEEIGITHTLADIKKIERDLFQLYFLDIDYDGPITWQFMDVLTDCISEWQKDMKKRL